MSGTEVPPEPARGAPTRPAAGRVDRCSRAGVDGRDFSGSAGDWPDESDKPRGCGTRNRYRCAGRSRQGHGPADPCTGCGQPCAQLGHCRGQHAGHENRAQPLPAVPNSASALSTGATRWAACADSARSTPSTPLTTATAVIFRGTPLVCNAGDGSPAVSLATCPLVGSGRPPVNHTEGTAGTPTTSGSGAGRTVGRPVPAIPGVPSTCVSGGALTAARTTWPA